MARHSSTAPDPLRKWTTREAEDLYGVSSWGREHFSVNEEGHLCVAAGESAIDVKLLIDDLDRRGIKMPILIRFTGLLKSRITELNNAFQQAIAEYEYGGDYRGVYPIKVNQSRGVVEGVTTFGRDFHYGLEAGSKPELLAVMANLDDREALVVCNGYKDRQYIETALLASKLRDAVVIVIEKPSELDLVRQVSEELGIRPMLGIRIRLASRGAGKWEQSGGDHAKFGLGASEILEAVNRLGEWNMLDTVELLHFHVGSQITAIRSIKDAMREACRMYAELVKLGCDKLRYLDVGGGLGVDYDGSQTNFESSMNYTMQEYANDVVWAAAEACNDANIPHPTLVSESGRAVVAHHSVLVVNVLGVNGAAPPGTPTEPPSDAPDVLHNLWHAYDKVNQKNVREFFHDALEYKEQMLSLFNLGHLSLRSRADCELLYWAACKKMADIAVTLPRVPNELIALERILGDTYFCNFSMFQSLPDMWAIDQLFPIMPIHRLDERPTRRGTIADITCDSDGLIDRFIDPRDVKKTLPLHVPNGEPYHIGFMLTGAYQEILGDMHNLFGDTNVVNVSFTADGGYQIDEVINGDTVGDVLAYVNYRPDSLTQSVRAQVEEAVRSGKMTLEESRHLMDRYQHALLAYTYLD